jgi:hypothetical protein
MLEKPRSNAIVCRSFEQDDEIREAALFRSSIDWGCRQRRSLCVAVPLRIDALRWCLMDLSFEI